MKKHYSALKNEDNYFATYDEIPDILIKMLIRSEDKFFMKHKGISFLSLASAIIYKITNFSVHRGGSSITTQLVKNVCEHQDRSLTTKINEALTAFLLEKTFSKNQILEYYLNIIYFGNGSWGVKSAAYYYFHKSIKDLTNNQCLALINTIPSPEMQNPYKNTSYFTVTKNMRIESFTPDIISKCEAKFLKNTYNENCIDPELVDYSKINHKVIIGNKDSTQIKNNVQFLKDDFNKKAYYEIPEDKTGHIVTYTNYSYFTFQNLWNENSKCLTVANLWKEKGCKHDIENVATINQYYLIACTRTFGNEGDIVIIKFDNNNQIACIIADIKGNPGESYNEYGHIYGDQICILELELCGSKDSCEIKNGNHVHPEWRRNISSITNLGRYSLLSQS